MVLKEVKSKMDLNRWMELAKIIAEDCGDILASKQHKFSQAQRIDHSPSTIYDQLAGMKIKMFLEKKTPFSVYTEEKDNPEKRCQEETFWWCDPIDGTKDFIKGKDGFCVSIGMVHQGQPVVGVVYQPKKKLLYSAILGNGTHLKNDGEIKNDPVLVNKDNDRHLIGVLGTRNTQQIENIYQEMGSQVHIGPYGGFICKVLTIVDGIGDVYIKPSSLCNEWDSCAIDVILTEAGGKLTNFLGEKLSYNQTNPKYNKGIVASNDLNHDKIVSQLQNYLV